MAKFNVVDMNGQHVSEIELSDAVFGITPNEKAVHIAVVNFLANQRQGTQNTKIRMEVSGGGKKPWHQKAGSVNTYDVLNADKLIISVDAAKKLEEVLG